MLIVVGLLLIATGGVLPLFFWPRLVAAKVPAVFGIGAGSLLGLWGAIVALSAPQAATWACDWLGALRLSFRVDILSAFFLLCIFAVSFLAALYSYHYLDDPSKTTRSVFSYLLLAVLIISMALVVCADNLISLALAWELMSISSGFLVFYDYEQLENRRAGYIYFIFTQAGALFLFTAFGVLFAQTGTFDLTGAENLSAGVKLAIFLLALVGFGSKAGVVPLHTWLPQAHPAAPSHVSALMSGIMIKMGIYGILRFYLVLAPETPAFGRIILVLGVITGIVGVAQALAQNNLKKLLAYSSIENVGIILIGLGLGMLGTASGRPTLAFWSFAGALLHLLNHALFKSLLFFGAGSVMHGSHTLEMDRLGGLMKRMRFTGLAFLIGSLAICGLPPFNGFVSELLIYVSAFRGSTLEGGDFLFAVMAVVSLAVIGGLAVACFTKVIGIVFLGEPRSIAAGEVHESKLSMKLAMMIPALACIIIGLAPMFLIRPISATTLQLLGRAAFPGADLRPVYINISFGAAVFLGIIVLILGLRTLLYRGKDIVQAPTWGCGFTRPTARIQYTGASYASPLVGFFRAIVPVRESFDGLKGLFPGLVNYQSLSEDRAEQLSVEAVAQPLVRLMKRLRWIQHGNIQLYIAYIVVAIIAAAMLISYPVFLP
ncbi:MAG: hydrogenase [Desulfuromonadaceae bacterium]|nr:hydrogenase [Desulfuromonadaceae bacterium]